MELPPPPPDGFDFWQNLPWRVVGSSIGTLIAFLVAWPTSRNDMIRRGIVSMLMGVTGGLVVRVFYFHWPPLPPFSLASAVICALFSWTAIGAAIKIIRTWSPKND